jgi:hypothetical protein
LRAGLPVHQIGDTREGKDRENALVHAGILSTSLDAPSYQIESSGHDGYFAARLISSLS